MSGEGADEGAVESETMAPLSSSSQLRLSSASFGASVSVRCHDTSVRARTCAPTPRCAIGTARYAGSEAHLRLKQRSVARALDGEAALLHGGLPDDAVLQDHLCERLVRVVLRGGCVSGAGNAGADGDAMGYVPAWQAYRR